MRIKFRLTLAFLAVAALGAIISFLLVQRSSEAIFRSFVFSGDSAKAKVYAGLIGEYYRTQGSWDGARRFVDELPDLFSNAANVRTHLDSTALRDLLSDRIVVVDARGVIVADTANLLIGTIHPPEHIAHGTPVTVVSERVGTVLVGTMIDSGLTGVSRQYLVDVTKALAFSTGLSAVLALSLGLLFAARITRPLANLAQAARNVPGGKVLVPLEETGDDELAALSRSFNEMTAEVRRLDEAKKQVIADSAHELRTPVTLIRGMIEGMMDGVYPLDAATLRSVHEETLRLSRLIDTLRELEVIDSGELKLDMDTVDLHEMATKAITLFAPSAGRKGISLVFEECGSAPYAARGDRFRLDEVFCNILSNAVNYTPAGGTIRIRELNADGETVAFSIGDSGPGIALDERKRVFERYYRVDKSRSAESGGRGLGLSIASEIVKAHGGTIEAGASDLGGALFTVSLPRA